MKEIEALLSPVLDWVFTHGWWFLLAEIAILVWWFETRGIHQYNKGINHRYK